MGDFLDFAENSDTFTFIYIKGSGPSVRLITLTSTSIIPDITKTSSNNCLIHDEDKVGEDRVLKVRENISLETCIEAVLKILNLFSPELSLVGPVL